MSEKTTKDNKEYRVFGIPDNIEDVPSALFRSRLITLTKEFTSEVELDEIEIIITSQNNKNSHRNSNKKNTRLKEIEEISLKKRAEQYKCINPYLNIPLTLPQTILDQLHSAIEIINLERKIFDDWGLRQIEPFPRTALNFHGAPGTGKTLAAHYVANRLKKNILIASYAQIESKFHGDGPKNVEAIFYAAERDKAILFIDEADSLLSKRLLNVTQGSEQAINSMRSQLLICLEKFTGVVVFATNLVENYDKAFETRVKNIEFPLPDKKCRYEIWKTHLPSSLPVSDKISLSTLAKINDISGRDIKNAVLDAALNVAISGRDKIEMNDFQNAIKLIKKSRIQRDSHKDNKENKKLSKQIKKAL